LPFPFLITHILRKKGIKSNATDGPITESPYFGRIQWNQSCPTCPEPHQSKSQSPWTFRRWQLSRREKPSQRGRQSKREEEKEYEETITLRAIDFYALQDTLEDIQFQIADIQRDARQDRLETQDMLRAILDRLPPTP
jgi:hypothetical protein